MTNPMTSLAIINGLRMGRVLLVEDDKVAGPWLARKLEAYGFSCTVAESSSEAIELFKAGDFHAVVTDIYLDGDKNKQEGLTVLKEIGKSGTPIIIMTSSADYEVAQTGLNHGASYLLEKPFEPERLMTILENIWEDPKGLQTLSERFFEYHGLTSKEKEISRMLLKGLSNREIGEALGNTEKTIKFHLTVIFDKCDVSSRTEFFNSIFPT